MTDKSRAPRPAAPLPTPTQLDTLIRTPLSELTVDMTSAVVDRVLADEQRQDAVDVARFNSSI